MSSSNNSSSGGVGFFGLLTLMLIGLKLTGLINTSWATIVLVFFSPLLIILSILTILISISGISAYRADRRYKKGK